jgi:hypothetical protein
LWITRFFGEVSNVVELNASGRRTRFSVVTRRRHMARGRDVHKDMMRLTLQIVAATLGTRYAYFPFGGGSRLCIGRS